MSIEKLATRTRQEQIVRAAMTLVSEQGMRGVSVTAIARRVGVVPSGVYRHFRNKDAIIDALLNTIRDLRKRLGPKREAVRNNIRLSGQ